MLTLDSRVRFTWCWSEFFLLEDDEGNCWVWSDPDYGGDNTIMPYEGTYEMFCKEIDIDFGRCKGQNVIQTFCGKDVQILDQLWAKNQMSS